MQYHKSAHLQYKGYIQALESLQQRLYSESLRLEQEDGSETDENKYTGPLNSISANQEDD